MKLITIQSSKPKWLDQATSEYVEKINHFQKFELIHLKSLKYSRDNAQEKRKVESELILKHLRPDEYIILLDEKGLVQDSLQVAKKIERLQTTGTRNITFVIGGAFGLDDSIKKRAQEIWRLSDLVFNHHIALLVTLEQIYRGYTIIKNKPYHNQ